MSLASSSDIAARLGHALSTAEAAAVTLLLEGADAIIGDATDTAVADLDATATPVLRFVAVEVVCRALANPQGISSLQEALGQHSSTVRFRELDTGGGLLLTKTEELLVRRAVIGQLSGTARPSSTSDEVYGYLYGS